MPTKRTAAKPPAEEKAARPTRKKMKSAPRPIDQDVQAPTLFALDFPQLHELIVSQQYTLRFTAPEDAVSLEISINDGPWQFARFSVGHWWYDWSGYEAGRHRLRARVLGPTGLEETLDRLCVVSLPEQPL